MLIAAVLLVLACNKTEQPEVISINGSSEYVLGNSAIILPVKISGATDWDYDLGGADWIKENVRKPSAIEFQVSANDTDEERTAEIRFFTPSKGARTSEASVKVRQAAKEFIPSLEFDPAGPLVIPSSGKTGCQVTVTTNLKTWEYEIIDAPSWLKASVSVNGLSFDVEANPAEEARTAIVDVYAPDKASRLAYKRLTINQEALVVDYDPETLGESGTANSYIITHRGQYSFNATVRGNGKTVSGLAAPAPVAATGAKLVWQSAKGMISSVSFSEGVITFFANRVFGNALIAATDIDGNILWSWHIWFPKEPVQALHVSSGFEVMNFNLGALSATAGDVESYGLLYQWGRKDPFPGSPRASGGDVSLKNVDVYDINGNVVAIGNHPDAMTVDYAIGNPTIAIGNRDQYYSKSCRDWITSGSGNDALWGNPDGKELQDGIYKNVGSKSFYDPCPPGWRVPPVSAFIKFTETGGMAWATGDAQKGLTWGDLGGSTNVAVVDYDGDGVYTLNDWKNGWHFWLDKNKGVASYFPATTRYDGQYALLMGSMVGLWGNYWLNAACEGGLGYAVAFGLKEYTGNWSITLSPAANGSKADAYAVRCIKE